MDDIRNYQIFFQLILIMLGYLTGYLEKSLFVLSLIIIPAILTQFFFINKHNWKSAMISSLSLILILKSHTPWIWPLISFFAIISKKLFQVGGKHFFNPSLFAIIIALLMFKEYVWISPGSWGEAILLMCAFIMSGVYILFKIPSKFTLISFIISYGAFLLLRMYYLSEPAAIYMHQVSNISFILFIFFMMSDPKTNPIKTSEQIIFGLLLATLSYYFKFVQFTPYFLYYSLFIMSLYIPLQHFRKRFFYA